MLVNNEFIFYKQTFQYKLLKNCKILISKIYLIIDIPSIDVCLKNIYCLDLMELKDGCGPIPAAKET